MVRFIQGSISRKKIYRILRFIGFENVNYFYLSIEQTLIKFL